MSRARSCISVVAFGLTAWVAACGGKLAATSNLDADSGAGPGVGKGGGRKDAGGMPPYPTYDAGVVPYPGFDGGPMSSSCPGPVDKSQIFPWKAPAPNTQGSCSESDLSALNTQLNDPNATFQTVYDSIKGSPSCQSCVFSSQGDANWQPIVWSPDQASGNAFVNYGACFALGPGGSNACGKAVEDNELCVDAACPYDVCTDYQGCAQQAEQSECAVYDKETISGCGSSINQISNACNDFVNELRIVCGGGTD
jgi:hypothetical protein